MTEQLEKLEQTANKLGFKVEFCSYLSWDKSCAKFYPNKRIVIGLRNYDPNTENSCGRGIISERVQELVLLHELGHVQNNLTIFVNIPIEEICLTTNIEFTIRQEIYAWKTALKESIETLTALELEFIQEQINEYVYCETIGKIIIQSQLELAETIIKKIKNGEKQK